MTALSPPDVQTAIIDWLRSPSAHGGEDVECVETHISVVFLAGSRALKLKRAVRFDYVDFSTLELRRSACESEVRINRRTAPMLYRGVVPVTREADGSLALGGRGDACEWLVEMTRFDGRHLLDRVAERGELDTATARALGAAIADFHREAEPRSDHGGATGMRWVVDGNAEGFAGPGRDILDRSAADAVTRDSRALIDRHAALLDARRAAGLVRQCHGDLHLRNIVLLDGQPTLFDAIEFNDAIACVDVLYDLAFLLMDLWRRQLPLHANAAFGAYVERMTVDDLDGLALLPLFLSCRAGVRAKTSATAATQQQGEAARRTLEHTAREYLTLAQRLVENTSPRLLAIGGYSGTGKSTVGRLVAPGVGTVPGAVVVRSDVLRKAMWGADETARLPDEAYAPEVSTAVYAHLRDRAGAALRAGHSVILDAVFGRADDRRAVEVVAADCGVPFTGVWLDAPAAVLEARVAARRGDASDADVAIVGSQVGRDPGPISWHRVDASQPPDVVARAVAERLGA
jgi:uncharacterized protein